MENFLPSKWEVKHFDEESVTLVYYGEKYPGHKKVTQEELNDIDYVGYVGIYRGKIAVYKGKPPNGELVEVTRYEVKDVYFHELKEGIKFENEEQKEQILESYTS